MLTWTIAGSTIDMAGFEAVCDVDDIGFGVASVATVDVDVTGVSCTLFGGVLTVGWGWCGYEVAVATGCCCGTCCCGVDVGTIFKSCICEPLTISISWYWIGPPGGQTATKGMHEYIDVASLPRVQFSLPDFNVIFLVFASKSLTTPVITTPPIRVTWRLIPTYSAMAKVLSCVRDMCGYIQLKGKEAEKQTRGDCVAQH